MVDTLTNENAGDDSRLLVVTLGRNQDPDRLTNNFGRRIAKNAFRPCIPTGNDAGQRLGQNRIVRRFDERRQMLGDF